MAEGKFKVDIVVSAKHHLIREGLKKLRWTQQKLCDHLNQVTGLHLRPSLISRWVCLKDFPKNPAVLAELVALFGHSPEELFPEFLKDERFLKLAKTATFTTEVDVRELVEKGLVPLPEVPTEALIRSERTEILNKILSSLGIRESDVIRRYFFQEESMPTIAKLYGMSVENVRQILQRALARMRHPERRNLLGQLFESPDLVEERLSFYPFPSSTEDQGMELDDEHEILFPIDFGESILLDEVEEE